MTEPTKNRRADDKNMQVLATKIAQRYCPNRWRVVPEPVPVNPAPEEPQ